MNQEEETIRCARPPGGIGNQPPALIPFGVGIGTGNVSSMVAATEGLSPHMHGASTGIVNTGGQVGNAMGLAILTAVSEMRKSALLSAHGGIDMATATVEGYKVAFLAGAGVALLGISALLIVEAGGG